MEDEWRLSLTSQTSLDERPVKTFGSVSHLIELIVYDAAFDYTMLAHTILILVSIPCPLPNHLSRFPYSAHPRLDPARIPIAQTLQLLSRRNSSRVRTSRLAHSGQPPATNAFEARPSHISGGSNVARAAQFPDLTTLRSPPNPKPARPGDAPRADCKPGSVYARVEWPLEHCRDPDLGSELAGSCSCSSRC
jgi:hypothetical protein